MVRFFLALWSLIRAWGRGVKQIEPVETALDAKDAAPVQRKPKVRVRTSKRTPKPYEPPKSLV